MTRRSIFAALLTAILVCACSVEGAPPAVTSAQPSASVAPSAPATRSPAPSVALMPSLVPCPSGGTPEAPIWLSAEEALACDLASAAEGRGTTLEEEYARHYAAEALGVISSRLTQERPDVFVGAAVGDASGGRPTLYIKGPADAFIRDLVAAAPIEIVIADNQPYSARELDERQMRLVESLTEIGYSNWAGGADIKTGRLYASITIEPGLPSTVPELLARLPAELRSGVDIEFSETPVAVDTIPQ